MRFHAAVMIATRAKNSWASFGLFYSAAIWGSTFFIVKDALADIDPIVLVGYRFLLAGVIMIPFLKITGRSLRHHWGKALFLSIILWSLYVPQTIGLKYTTASNSGFITGLFVAFVPVFQRLFFRQTPSRMEIIASAVSLSGLWILTGGLHDINLGDMLTLIAAMTYALHLLIADRYLKTDIDPFVISCQQFLIIGILSLVTALVFDLPFSIGTLGAGGTVVFLALFPTLSAFVIQMVAQKIVTPLRVSLVFALEPVFAALFAWTLGGETVIFHRAMGGLLIFFSLIISGIPSPARKK